MRIKSTVTLFAAAISIIGIMLLQSCTMEKVENSTAENENIEVESTEMENTEVDIIEVDNEKSTDSPTIEEVRRNINLIKMEIEQILDDNYDLFTQIMEYFEKDNGRYIISIVDGEISVLLDTAPGFRQIDISDIEIGEQIEYVLYDLRFEDIRTEDYYVRFLKLTGSTPSAGAYQQSLFCNKSSAGEKRIYEDDNYPSGETVRIRDEWFYDMASRGIILVR